VTLREKKCRRTKQRDPRLEPWRNKDPKEDYGKRKVRNDRRIKKW
jgi:hypothetical protein